MLICYVWGIQSIFGSSPGNENNQQQGSLPQLAALGQFGGNQSTTATATTSTSPGQKHGEVVMDQHNNNNNYSQVIADSDREAWLAMDSSLLTTSLLLPAKPIWAFFHYADKTPR